MLKLDEADFPIHEAMVLVVPSCCLSKQGYQAPTFPRYERGSSLKQVTTHPHSSPCRAVSGLAVARNRSGGGSTLQRAMMALWAS
jgi:hypothetical protein